MIATLGAAAMFGFMHADMKGSVGIVRVVATTCLGLACGSVRWATGSALASVLLHFAYNTLSVGLGRGWFASTSGPMLSAVPNPLLIIAGASIAALLLLTTKAVRRAPASSRSRTTF